MPITPGSGTPLLVISGVEIFWVLLAIVVIFGASRLPSLGRNLGQGIKEFKRGVGEAVRDDEKPDASGKPDTSGTPGRNDATPQDRPATTEQPADGTATREERT